MADVELNSTPVMICDHHFITMRLPDVIEMCLVLFIKARLIIINLIEF